MNLEWLVARDISAQSASRARAGVINTRAQSYWTWCPFVVEYLPSYSNVFAESRAFSFSFVVCVNWKSMYFFNTTRKSALGVFGLLISFCITSCVVVFIHQIRSSPNDQRIIQRCEYSICCSVRLQVYFAYVANKQKRIYFT